MVPEVFYFVGSSGARFWVPLAIVVVLAATTFGCSGLVALWAGWGRAPWFWRMAALVCIAGLPLAISADDLAPVFLIQFVLLTLPPLIYRAFRRWRTPETAPDSTTSALRKDQFTLRGLFLLTLLVAMLAAIMARLPGAIWAEWFVRPPDDSSMEFAYWYDALEGVPWFLWLTALCVFLPALPIAALLGCAWGAGLLSGAGAKSAWFRRLAHSAVVVLSLLLLFPPLLAIYLLVVPRPIPAARPALNPNGYDDLIRLSRAIGDVELPEDLGDPAALELFVLTHRQVLDEAHAVLKHPCQRRLRYHWSDFADDHGNRTYDVNPLRNALVMEGWLAHVENRETDLLRSFSDLFRLSVAVQREGNRQHSGMGWCVNSTGVSGLAEIRRLLNRNQCRELVTFLQKIHDEQEPLSAIEARENAWKDRVLPWSRLFWRLQEMVAPGMPPTIKDDWSIHEAKFQLLMGELALQWYGREHDNSFPATLDALVPEYLSTVPQDPYVGKPLIYRLTPHGYLLYSVCSNGKDDGGRPLRIRPGEFDLFVNDPKDDDSPDTPVAGTSE